MADGTQHNCESELRDAELKATPARLGVLKLLEKTGTPVDVATIISYLQKQHIKADPVTAFRIINLFTDKGLVKKIQLQEGKFRYELSSKEDHHHLVCKKCSSIEDIADCTLNVLEKDIKKKKKFHVTNHSLEFFGICADCQNSI